MVVAGKSKCCIKRVIGDYANLVEPQCPWGRGRQIKEPDRTVAMNRSILPSFENRFPPAVQRAGMMQGYKLQSGSSASCLLASKGIRAETIKAWKFKIEADTCKS